MSVNKVKQVHSLVLDAGPILKNEPTVSTLLGQAEALYTVPSVIEEIRDAVARLRVETTLLPFLKLRTPRPASIKIISDFARKTGDYEVLSKADMQILALAYELECERNHGDWRLRSVPGQKRVNGAPPASLSEKTLDLLLSQWAKCLMLKSCLYKRHRELGTPPYHHTESISISHTYGNNRQ